MNKDRRARISAAISALEGLGALLRDLENEEQEAYDNMPEGLQSGDRGNTMQDTINYLASAAGEVEQAAEELGNITHR